METLLVLVAVLVILRLLEVVVILILAVNFLFRRINKDLEEMLSESKDS